jgi:hypothetical protein
MEKYLDKTLPKKERQAEYKKSIEKLMNPFDNFNPDTFEPLASVEEQEYTYRKRIKPPVSLPTFNLNPKEILEGQLIGMCESKQDLYLIFAHRCNDLQAEIELLKEEIKKLKLK